MLEFLEHYRSVFVVICSGVILFRGLQFGNLRRYTAFYLFVLTKAVSVSISLLVIGLWEIQDIRYLFFHIISLITIYIATFILLIWLMSLPGRLRKRDLAIVAFSLTVSIAGELLLSSGGHFVWHLYRGGAFFLMLTTLQATYRCLTPLNFKLGRNMGSVLLAVFLLLAQETLNSHFYLTSAWAYENLANLFGLSAVAAWGFIAWGMWDFDPPRQER